jgi:CheY-like chemotaxis protein
MLVEDEADTREVVTAMLTGCGANVSTAASAEEALAVLEKSSADEKPEVLVSDIGMPGKDGYELIREVRALEEGRGKEIPAIALTGYASREERGRAILAGFQMHIAKPVKLEELAAGVARLAGRT